MISLDTNVVLRYLLNDIPAQTTQAAKVITGSPVYVTDVVMTEVVFVLERAIGLSRNDIVRLVRAFLGLPRVVYNDHLLDEALTLYRAQKSLSFVDCYAAAEAGTYQHTLVTFDKALAKNGGRQVRELT